MMESSINRTSINNAKPVGWALAFAVLTISGALSISIGKTVFASKAHVPGTSINGSASSVLIKADRVKADRTSGTRLHEAFSKLPLSFEANQGQADAQVKFLSRGSGYSLFLTAHEAVLSLVQSPRRPGAHREGA